MIAAGLNIGSLKLKAVKSQNGGLVMAGRVTPLVDHHKRLGARFTEFGGWEMPFSTPALLTSI